MKKPLILILTLLFYMFIVGCSGSNDQSGAPSKKQVYAGVSGSSFQVSAGLNNEEQPAIAYDREGRYLSVWSDYRNSGASPVKGSDIYGKICDGSTAATGLNATPPVCSADFPIAIGDGNQWQPKVAYDYISKKYLVVFADTSAGYSIIKGQLITQAEANSVSSVYSDAVFNVSQHLDSADPSQIEPEVVYNDFKNNFTVAWLGTSNYDTADYPGVTNSSAAAFTPTWKSGDSAVIANANKITSITQGTKTITNYSVLPILSDRNTTQTTVTLGALSNAIGTSSDLSVIYLDASKLSDGSNSPVPSPFGANQGYKILNSSGSATATEKLSTLNKVDFAYFFLDVGMTIPATGVNQNTLANDLSFGVTSSSNLLTLSTPVYWRALEASSYTWLKPKWSAGDPLIISNVYNGANSAPYTVTLTSGSDVKNQFDIVISGNTLLATLKTGSSLINTNSTVTVTYTPIKNLYGPVVGRGCGNSYGPIPYIPISHAGSNLVAYVNVSSAGTVTIPTDFAYSQLVHKSLTDSGSAIVQTWTVSDNETKPRLAYNPLDGNPFLVWSGSQFDETLTISYALDPNNPGSCTYSSLFTKNPLAAATPQKIIMRRFINSLANDILLGTSAFYPAISIDPTAKRMLVAWEEQGNMATTGKDINAHLIDITNFISYGSLITASNATGDQTSPVAAYDTVNQRHLVIWEDARNQSANLSNIDIYGQFVDPQGNLSGGNVPINVDQGNQLSPVLAFGDVNYRQFLLLWKDARLPGNSDIFGQLMKYSVLPQMVVTDVTNAPILNGALDFGNVAVGLATPTEKIIRLRNDGNTTLTISSMSTPAAPFSFRTPAPVNINPGNFYEMKIGFQPTAGGSYTGNASNAFKTDILSDGGNTTLYFSGTGDGINTLSITSSSIPDTIPTVAKDTTLTTFSATGGVYPYTWNLTLPPGVTLGSNVSFDAATGELKQLAGQTIPAGKYSIVISVTDSNNPKITSSIQTLPLNVGTIAINTTTPLSAWTLGVDYSLAPVYSLTATGGTGSITWMLASGSLPGLVLNSNGNFSGTATSTGQYAFTVTATDTSVPQQTATSPFSITINPSPSILTTSLPPAIMGSSYSQTLSVTGGTAPLIWSVSGGLPSGISFDTGKGIFSGTPTNTASFPLTLSVQDAAGVKDTKSLTIVVNGSLGIATPTTGTGSPDVALVGTAYNFVLKSNNGGIVPYTWSVTKGALPTGLGLNVNTGVITGTPTSAGEYIFTVQLLDSVGTVASQTFTINTIQTGTAFGVQLLTSPGVISSSSAVSLSSLSTAPTGFTPVSAAQMTISNVTSGATVSLAVTFPSLPAADVRHFFKVNGTQWIEFTPDSISGSTIFYKIKDRVSTSETDPIALRDTNILPGIIEDPIVVTTSAAGTTSGGGSTIGSVSASGGGSGCFIATAAYGSYLDPHVMALRNFRDHVLLQSELGSDFVAFYYKHSPPIADFIAQHDILRMIMRVALTPLIFVVKYPLVAALLFVLVCSWFIRRKMTTRVDTLSSRQIEVTL